MNKVKELLITEPDFTELSMYLDIPEVVKWICDNDIFYKNIDLIIKNYRTSTSFIIMKLASYNEKYILDNCFSLMPYYLDGKIDSDYIFAIRNIGCNKIIDYLKKNNVILEDINLFRCLLNIYKDKTDIVNNIDYFINNTISLLDLKELLIEYNIPGVDKINYILDNDREKLVLDLVYPNTGLKLDILKQEKIYDTVRLLVEDLALKENVHLHDIKHIATGGYSNVLQVGSKILKLGKKRKNFSIKNNKRFLAGFRGEIKSFYFDDVILTYEITETVDTEHIVNINLYELYKELRDKKLIWTDCHKGNVGILLKDNKVYYKDIDYIDKNATGYTSENKEILKKGDVVILDNDYIFTEEEFQRLFNNNKSLEANISSVPSIAWFEYQYQLDKVNKNRKVK